MKDLVDAGLRQHSDTTIADVGVNRLKLLCYSSGRLFDHYELVAGRIADAYTKIQREQTDMGYADLCNGEPRSFVHPQPPEEEAIRKDLFWVQHIGPIIRLLFCPGTTRYLYLHKEKFPTHFTSRIMYSPFARVCLWLSSKSVKPDTRMQSTAPLPTYFAQPPPVPERVTEIISRLSVSFVSEFNRMLADCTHA